jgi:hypothetical protein
VAGEHDHGRPVGHAHAPELAEELDPVGLREPEVGDDEVEALLARARDRLLGRERGAGLEPGLGEHLRDDDVHREVVIDDQDPLGHGFRAVIPRSRTP